MPHQVQWVMFVTLSLSLAKSALQQKLKQDRVYNVTFLLDTLLEKYDKQLRPGFGGPPLVVDVNLNIRSMGPISELDMAYQMDCYFRQSWFDSRLKYPANGTPSVLPVAINILDRLWKPDTHFFNGKKSYLHTVTSPNKLLRIRQDGHILYSMRLTIKASCPMHLENFPMDLQKCPLTFGSHGYAIPDVIYKWTYGDDQSIKMAPDMTLSQFDLVENPHGEELKQQHGVGTFSVLYVNFYLRRHMGYFLINVYVPCSLLVVLSWVAFWINREATADRVALGITVVLTMCFMNIDNRRDIPEVSYATALDIFVGVCFAFVIATIIQFAGVHFFTKHGSGDIQHDTDSEEEMEAEIDNTVRNHLYARKVNGNTNSVYQCRGLLPPRVHKQDFFLDKFWNCILGSSSYQKRQRMYSENKSFNSVSQIDKISRIIFPLTFSAFHVIYWAIYVKDSAHMVL